MKQRSRREIWAEAVAYVKFWRSEGGLYDTLGGLSTVPQGRNKCASRAREEP